MASYNPAAPAPLPAVGSLPSLDDAALASTLDKLFESSPDMHSLAIPILGTVSFTSYDDLINGLRDQLLSFAAAAADNDDARRHLHGVLASHPRLGAEKPEALGEQSRAEQAGLRTADGEEKVLARLNEEYEAKFPGLRYVVFVNGRGRDVITEDMRRRIDRGDIRAEEREAIEAMCNIAKDRAAKLQKTLPS